MPAVTGFDYDARTRIVFGWNRIDDLGQFARELGGSRVLVVSDAGVIAAGHTQRGLDSLRRAGLQTAVFQEFSQNPDTRHVDAGVAVARDAAIDLLVGLGGGSSMDCAKGINFLLTNGGRMQDYWGVGKATRPMLPMIAVPTTSGTGSEAQSFALISDAQTHVKMACGDKKAACRVALLDPGLTVTQPRAVTAVTGIDAIAHALETYVTTRRNPMSLAFSREAWGLLARNFARVLEHPADLEARAAMQLGACFAGMAIENSMLGAAHALANPLTARYGTIHGQAVGIMLPHVIRFNAQQVGDWYRQLLATSDTEDLVAPRQGAEAIAVFVTRLLELAGFPICLSSCGVQPEAIPHLAQQAATQWTGQFNPREIGEASLGELYRQACA